MSITTKTEVVITVDGAESGRYILDPGEYLIGRHPDCAIQVEAGLVSRNHARLTVQEDGWLIEDLGSSNGTLLDDQPVTGDSQRVEPTQTISIGSAKLFVRALPAEGGERREENTAPLSIRALLPPEFQPERRYEVGALVAKGGMGAVLNASDLATKRQVAMKVLHSQEDRDDLLRFIEEAQVTAQLEHPNIVPVHELSVDAEDRVFYTMKLVRGITLRKVLELLDQGVAATVKKYSLAALLTVFQKVCDAIAFAHARGVIHRDLKPENIMIGDFGEVLVMDWGLAKLLGRAERVGTAVESIKSQDGDVFSTLSGTIMGTPQYMAPEQAEGAIERIDARSDIYALGAILYHLLALHAPIDDTDLRKLLARVVAGDIRPPSIYTQGKKRLPHLPGGRVPDALSAVTMKAMALHPAARYQTVAEFQADIMAYQDGFATSAEHAGAARQLLLFMRRNKLRAAVAAVFLVLVAGFMVKVIAAERRGAALLARLTSTAPILHTQAELEIEKGDFARALEHIDYAVELAPRDPGHLTLKGHILQDLLRFPEARDAYRTVLHFNPNHEDAKRNLSLVQTLLEDGSAGGDLSVPARTLLVNSLTSQGRLREAVILGRPLNQNRSQLVETWKAVLAKAGIPNGDIRPLPDGRLHFVLNNQVEDISFLRGAPIGRLEAYNSRITDLSPLHGSTLSDLSIEGAPINDLRPLEGLPLTSLNIGRTKVSDLAPLRDLPLKVLRIHSTLVQDLSPLSKLPLEVLSMESLGDIETSPLAGLPLRELYFSGTNVRDLSMIRGMALEKLALGHLKNSDLSLLQGMPLEELRANDLASSPPFFDLTPLRNLPLKVLELERNGAINDLSALRGLPLTALKISSTGVTDLRPLEGAPLYRLEASHTRVRDLQPLAKMTSLRVLKLDNTPVADLTPVLGLPIAALQVNRCSELRDFAPLAALRALKRLSLPIHAQGVAALRGLTDINWIATGGPPPPESDTDGSRARQFWQDADLEEKVRAADPARLLRPSRFPAMVRRFPGAVQNGSHWYLYVDSPVAWTQAKELAELMGGHLATVTSKEEDDFVLRSFGSRIGNGRAIFLGARADRAMGTWQWITGEPWNYTRWARSGGRESEPNGVINSADPSPPLFLTLRSAGNYTNSPAWDDTNERNNEVLGFLVEWED